MHAHSSANLWLVLLLTTLTIGGTLSVLIVMGAVSWGQSSLIDHAAPRYQLKRALSRAEVPQA